MDEGVSWNGEDLERALKDFDDKVTKRLLRKALRQSATEGTNLLKASAPAKTGRLRASIAARTTSHHGQLSAQVVIFKKGKRSDPRNAFYWRYVAFGHRTRGRGKHPSLYAFARRRPARAPAPAQRQVPPNPFIANVWMRFQQTVSQSFYRILEDAVKGQLTKQGKS